MAGALLSKGAAFADNEIGPGELKIDPSAGLVSTMYGGSMVVELTLMTIGEEVAVAPLSPTAVAVMK
jgi:hypothetical protein